MGSSCKCIVLIGNKVYGISHCCKSQVRSFDLCLVRGISACDIACIVTNMPRQSNNLRKTNFWVCEIPLLTATECNQLGQTVLYSITMRAWSLLYSEWAWTFSIAKKKKKKKNYGFRVCKLSYSPAVQLDAFFFDTALAERWWAFRSRTWPCCEGSMYATSNPLVTTGALLNFVDSVISRRKQNNPKSKLGLERIDAVAWFVLLRWT